MAPVPTWHELLEDARWAPSPHNIQPWRLRVLSEGEAELRCDPDRLLPETDPTGRFSVVGLGVFVETLRVAARARGADVEHELVGALDGGVFGRLRLVPFAGREELGREEINARRTSRIPYDGSPVDERLLGALSATATASGHRLAWSSDPQLVDWILHLNRETLFFDLTDPGARREIGAWLRFSGREARRRRDGFSPECLGFPGWLLRLYFRAAPAFELPGARQAVRALHARTTRGTRTVAWLSGPFDEPADWLRAGELLGRLWLELTRSGLVLHPFGSIVTNREANARLLERISPPEGLLWLVMRLGRSAEPPRSLRLETDELLVG